jgi:uncharacterized protein (DUF58 family)
VIDLPPALVARLTRSRLRLGAPATGGIGERRSRDVGSGMEFAEYREYQDGDDLRHLDRFVFARTGKYHVRRFHVDRQLHAVIVVDGSPGMQHGEPSKSRRAREIAAGLACVAVAGGDRAKVGVSDGDVVRWFPPLTRAQQLPRLTEWLGAEVEAAGEPIDPTRVGRSVTAANPHRGLVMIVSDWMFTDAGRMIALLRAQGHEPWALQVLAPDEIDPLPLGDGPCWLQAAGERTPLAIDLSDATRARYAEAFSGWQVELAEAIRSSGGRLLRADDDLETLFTRHLVREGLVE